MTKHHHDLIEILTRDHRELEGLLRQLGAARDPVERQRILDDVTTELVWLAAVEETHLYPAVRRHVPDGERIAERWTSDNAEVKRLLRDLQRSATGDEIFTALSRRLIHGVYDHIREEQSSLLPRLAEHVGPEDLRRLGEQVESAGAPSREPDAGMRPRQPRQPRQPGQPGQPLRPRTPREPNPNERGSMWPDLWASHRYW